MTTTTIVDARSTTAYLKTTLTYFSTGVCKIKSSMYTQPATRSVLFRRLRLLTDTTWTDNVPIGVFLINHPEGPFLFDTGESPCCNDAGYFPAWNFAIKSMNVTTIEKFDGVVAQLRNHGVEPMDLKGIIVSHLHRDHAGGLEDLAREAPDVPVYVSKQHWEVFGNNPIKASIEGCVPGHWPKNFAPKILELKDYVIGPWKQSYPLTKDGRVVVVDTPGHVPGHVSMIVRGENADDTETTYFLTGDATYGIDLLDSEETDGVNDDPQTALRSLRMIKEFAKQEDVVILPSHDNNTPRMLKEKEVYRPKIITPSE